MAGESRLWDFLRVRMPVGSHYSRIESETSPGFPDVHYTIQGHSGTLELKSEPEPSGSYPFKKSFRKSQKDWIKSELEAGGHITLVLQHRKDIYFLSGWLYKQLEQMTIKEIANKADLIWMEDSPISPVGLLGVLMNY